ncbi:unnamed protein product [Paramecium sonneborni]|uniref:Uncharacterized protein n=1 Tax=Paramecium sonneborni TaxID=65129 RepID=A0A8S1PV34_9CILI|nr:unnamed protein product [Paramecium sonneborni]
MIHLIVKIHNNRQHFQQFFATNKNLITLKNNYLQRYKKQAIMKDGQVIQNKKQIKMYFGKEQIFDLKQQNITIVQYKINQQMRKNNCNTKLKQTQQSIFFYLKHQDQVTIDGYQTLQL